MDAEEPAPEGDAVLDVDSAPLAAPAMKSTATFKQENTRMSAGKSARRAVFGRSITFLTRGRRAST